MNFLKVIMSQGITDNSTLTVTLKDKNMIVVRPGVKESLNYIVIFKEKDEKGY